MRNVITMLSLMFATAVYADSYTVIQDMNGNFVATAMTFGARPATIYNPNEIE